MDNILLNIPKKIMSNINKVTVNNKLTFGDINLKNLTLNGTNNYINFNNLYASSINIKPIIVNGTFNIFQFNNYGKSFSFDVDYSNKDKKDKITDNFYDNIKKYERDMENYITGLTIKCYQNLDLANFNIDATTIGENIIYIKDCVVDGDLTINLAGRSLVMIDNTDIIGKLRFNLKTEYSPEKKLEKNNIMMKSLNKLAEDKKSSNMLMIVIIIILLIIGYFIINKKIDNNNKYDN